MKWRDVHEKMPANNAVVLCWDDEHGHQLGCYSNIGKMWLADNRKIRNLDPVAWQPLPPAPVDDEVEVGE